MNEAKERLVKPTRIITLCGSTKFKEDFERVNKKLTLAGNIVISVACFGHSGDIFTDEQKVLLDEVHKRKIDLADEIYVINKGGYIGESTKSEIEYATEHGKIVTYMENHHKTPKPCQNQFKVGGRYVYAFDNKEGHTEAVVEIVRKLNQAAIIKFIEVHEEHTGNNFFSYLLKTGETMAASYRFLTEIK